MEAAVRSVQVGPPTQRVDTGLPQQTSTISYQQRISSGASPVHRPVDTPQSYSKASSAQTSSRSAASPLSPPKQGSGASATYTSYSGATAREAPVRYVQQCLYGATVCFGDKPYARVPTQNRQIDYHISPSVVSVSNDLSVAVRGSRNTMETGGVNRRISIMPHTTEYLHGRLNQGIHDSRDSPTFKKIRLSGNNQTSPSSLLKVDTRDTLHASEAYHPQVEAISPTLPSDPSEELRATKDELLQQISKVDMEIVKVEKTINMLKKKEALLKEASVKPATTEETSEIQPKHRSLAQQIYVDNRKKANLAHAILIPLGSQIDLPLYNQPSDAEICRDVIKNDVMFKPRLLLHCQKLKTERAARNNDFAERYSQKSQEWLRRIDKAEASAKRKAKEAKNREFFEKVFPELRKQREDKERFNRVGSRIKSEADLEEIMDGLQEQAMEDKKMRSYAVIPPLLLDVHQRHFIFLNENGSLIDMSTDYKERQNLNIWTNGEKEIFKEKFLQHPKNFGAIATCLDRKNAQDCVRYYYLSKKTENYKQLLRKARQRTRSSRNPQKSLQNQSTSIADALTTGVTTRLQRELQQKTGGRDRAANSAVNTNCNSAVAGAVGIATTMALPSAIFSSNSIINVSNSISNITTTAMSTTETKIISANCTYNCYLTTSDNLDESSFHASSVIEDNFKDDKKTDKQAIVSLSKIDFSIPISSTVMTSSLTNFAEKSHISSFSSNNCLLQNSVKAETISAMPSPINSSLIMSSIESGVDLGIVASSNNEASCSTELLLHQIKKDNSMCNENDEGKSSASTFKTVTMSHKSTDDDTATEEKIDEFSDIKKRRKDPSETSEEDCLLENKEKLYTCFICKTELCSRTRPLEKGRGQQYGILEETILPGARVCNTCQCKSIRSRYPNCPIPTCPNPKDRVKRFRNLPPKLFELPPDIKDPILQEFQIPLHISKCCSACLIRIRRKLGPHLQGINLTDEEIDKFKSLLLEKGLNWSQLAEVLDKPARVLRLFYFHYKKKYALDVIVGEYYDKHPSEERHSILTDIDESDLSTSSCDEREVNSDTASAESPNNPVTLNTPKEINSDVISISVEKPFEDERLLPPLGHIPKKQKQLEECDSSATETADEENESSPANRQSPKVLVHPNQTTITMVSSTINSRESVGSPLNVRDVMLNVIERSLKSAPQQKSVSVPIMKSINSIESRNEITFARDCRNELMKPSLTRPTQGDGLATLSVVNHMGHTAQMLSPHSQIAATITPVPSSSQQTVQTSLSNCISNENSVVYTRNESEPQTLDLSIKKTQRDTFFPPAHLKQQLNNSVSGNVAFRNETSQSHCLLPQTNMATHSSTFLGYHHELNHTSKSSSVYVSTVPVSLNQQHSVQGGRLHLLSPIVQLQQVQPEQHQQGQQKQSMQQQQQQQQSPSTQQLQQSPIQHQISKVKVSPKFNPKSQHQQESQATTGLKGSITHGTPVNSGGQSNLVQSSTSLSPRFENILRRTPPSNDKIGSITQGTPVHVSSHNICEKQRAYEYYKYNRQGLTQVPSQQTSPQTQNFSSPYARSAAFNLEQQQLSSRQIIMNDYITSQQMHGQQGRGSRSDKDSASPRSAPSLSGSPVTLYYADKDRGSRSEYLSRTSLTEHANSSPNPQRTPPPQRQGVIQRHNTGTTKSTSPVSNRLHVIQQQQHNYPPGHEAISLFVDVAVQQPLLPVPHKEEKRQAIITNEHSSQQDLRYQMSLQQQIQRQRQQYDIQRCQPPQLLLQQQSPLKQQHEGQLTQQIQQKLKPEYQEQEPLKEQCLKQEYKQEQHKSIEPQFRLHHQDQQLQQQPQKQLQKHQYQQKQQQMQDQLSQQQKRQQQLQQKQQQEQQERKQQQRLQEQKRQEQRQKDQYIQQQDEQYQEQSKQQQLLLQEEQHQQSLQEQQSKQQYLEQKQDQQLISKQEKEILQDPPEKFEHSQQERQLQQQDLLQQEQKHQKTDDIHLHQPQEQQQSEQLEQQKLPYNKQIQQEKSQQKQLQEIQELQEEHLQQQQFQTSNNLPVCKDQLLGRDEAFLDRDREQLQERERNKQIDRERQIAEKHVDRDRNKLSERDKNIQSEHERSIQNERERERITQDTIQNLDKIDDKERHEQASRLLVGISSSFLRDSQAVTKNVLDRDKERDRLESRSIGPSRSTDGTLTAANLIDAIITHQINQAATEPPPGLSRDTNRSLFLTTRDSHTTATENNRKSISPNIINIDMDSDSIRNPNIVTKNITIGQLADSIITKDYGPKPFLPLRQPFMQYHQDSIVSTDQWKVNKNRMQQQKEDQHLKQLQSQQQQVQKQSQTMQETMKTCNIDRITSDERQIIHVAQSLSPRHKSFHESVSPLENNFYPLSNAIVNPDRRIQSAVHQTQFALDCYVKNRIVEAMRTEDEKRSEESHERQQHELHAHMHTFNKIGIDGSSMPMEIEIGETPTMSHHSSGSEQQSNTIVVHNSLSSVQNQYTQSTSVTTFTNTYAYPFSALNVSGTVTNVLSAVIPTKPVSIESDQQRSQSLQITEPKPLLSAQYEELSDEE